MNTQTNAMSESSVGSQVLPPAAVSGTRHIYWALQREFWENRSIYIAPLAVAGVALFGFLVTLAHHLPQKMRTVSNPMQLHDEILQPYDIVASMLMGTFLLVAVFYCIETLQRERRDRSILFWKSLPVSDLTTVAAKASVPFVVLPLFFCSITLVTQFIMLLVASAVLAGNGLSVSAYWEQVPLLQMWFLLLYHVLTVHVLGAAPVYGWLLFVSAWAKRAAFLWAVLPPLAIVALEKLLFNTAHFPAFLLGFLTGYGTEAIMAPDTMPMDPMTHLTPFKFLSTPGLWIGLAVTVAFLAAAVRLRRYRGAA